MKILTTLDLYINIWFQKVLNTFRRVGVRPTWFIIATHIGALYFFLVCAGMSALVDDLFGLVLCCLVATWLLLLLVRVFYEAFLVIVGEGSMVDEVRVRFQNDMLNRNNLISRPVCLIGACTLLMVDPGVYPPMEPFLLGFLLLSTGFYLETCV